MRCGAQLTKVTLIANLIGESGEAAKQPLPDLLPAISHNQVPQLSGINNNVGAPSFPIFWERVGERVSGLILSGLDAAAESAQSRLTKGLS